jgi:hypothetical protein
MHDAARDEGGAARPDLDALSPAIVKVRAPERPYTVCSQAHDGAGRHLACGGTVISNMSSAPPVSCFVRRKRS